jgi:hypothetical protein
MMRLLRLLAARYHRARLLALRSERAWHAQQGAPDDHPHMRGLDFEVAHHDKELTLLGYMQAERNKAA